MKMFATGCVIAVLATVAVQFASSATSTHAVSIPRRVKTLEAKVKSLTASVKTLKSDVATLKTKADCFGAQGVTQYGNPIAGQGYLWTSDGGSTIGLATAFDGPTAGQAPQFYVATLNAACITSKSFALGPVVLHRTAERRLP